MVCDWYHPHHSLPYSVLLPESKPCTEFYQKENNAQINLVMKSK